MTGPFDGVDVLLPLHVHQTRKRLAHQLATDLAALIQALPTASRTGAAVVPDDADPDQFKTWALAVIGALPTRTEGAIDHGDR